MTAPSGLEVGSFKCWLPVPPTDDQGHWMRWLIEEYVVDDPAGEDVVRRLGADLCALSARDAARTTDDLHIVASWALLPVHGQRLEVRGWATLATAQIAAGSTIDVAVDLLVEGAEHYQPPYVQDLMTECGEAQLVRLRTSGEADGLTHVVETCVVLWLRPASGEVLVLSSLPTSDLVRAAEVADTLAWLAETVSGW